MPGHAIFWAVIGKEKFGSTLPQILGKTGAVWRHVTECDAAEPFHDLHMGPMSDDAVSNQLLGPHLCPAMALVGLRLKNGWHSIANFGQN